VGLVYHPRGLAGVTTARPGVAGVLHAARLWLINFLKGSVTSWDQMCAIFIENF
jgi:hypothetical protein